MELCDLAEQPLPEDTEREVHAIRIIARAIVGCLQKGEGVFVHCVGGRGRTGTGIGCVLLELGHPADEIVADLHRIHKQRGKPDWPEANWQQRVVEGSPGTID